MSRRSSSQPIGPPRAPPRARGGAPRRGALTIPPGGAACPEQTMRPMRNAVHTFRRVRSLAHVPRREVLMRRQIEGGPRPGRRAGVAATLALAILGLGTADGAAQGGGKPAKEPPVKVGLAVNAPGAFQGYTLIAPLNSRN